MDRRRLQTVCFEPNFDGQCRRPLILAARRAEGRMAPLAGTGRLTTALG